MAIKAVGLGIFLIVVLELFYIKITHGTTVYPVIDFFLSIAVILTVAVFFIIQGKQAEEAVKDSDEKFRDLFENANELIQSVDIDGNFDYVNKKWQEVLGYSNDEVQRLKLTDILRKDQIPHYMEVFKRVCAGEVLDNVETVFMTKEGHEVIVQGNVNGQFKKGEFVATRGLFHDVTERKFVEEQLEFSEKRFKDMAELLPQTVFEIDREGNITYTNRFGFETFGYAPEDLDEGIRVAQLFISEDIERIFVNIQKALNGETPEAHEYVAIRKDGSTFPVLVSSSPIMYDNEPVGLRGIMMDITERKRMEAELQRTMKELEAKNQELEDYTYTVSHDLKAPLVTIQGFAELLNAKYADQLDKKARHYMERITQGADNLGRLVSDLLELSRAGRKTNTFEWHDFNEILEVSLTGLEGKFNERKIEVTYPEDFPKVHCDDMRIEQVMSNLIGNAVNYMGGQTEPSIDIGWKKKESQYLFWVKDNGIGIREEEQDRIFKVFERATESEEGSGLGLSIVKKIIQVHGGEIGVESVFGKGSTFYFTLPKMGVEE